MYSVPNTEITALQNLYMKTCRLTHAYVLVNKIASNSLCKHPNNGVVFFIKGESKLTKGVPVAFEVIIMAYHSDLNAVHMPRNTEEATTNFG